MRDYRKHDEDIEEDNIETISFMQLAARHLGYRMEAIRLGRTERLLKEKMRADRKLNQIYSH